jgi:pyruvate kinase
MTDAIVTVPPYAPFLHEVAEHPLVSGIRLNTVMPVKESLDELLRRLQEAIGERKLWIDLKGRQLRVKTFGVPPFTEIELTHKIEVETPVRAYFSGGEEYATVLAVDGNRLIMQEGPSRVVGPGESVNIPDPSLRVLGYLTDTDKRYIDAGLKTGHHAYMLSFIEGRRDVERFAGYDSGAELVAKIESKKGMAYVANDWDGGVRLMAARGDLYLELDLPHHLPAAVEQIVRKDSRAIAASRILPSLGHGSFPSAQDIGDVDCLFRMGYRTFMLGDELCLRRESLLSALNLLEAMASNYVDAS